MHANALVMIVDSLRKAASEATSAPDDSKR